ncbi:AraC family transcriptional regulator [Leptospira gomenensis]|uniref:AraC family transcriptional regulator n=1 Tax=Leptospira gomenensis TaxID=2484974 RepID=A0A5F1YFP4_9LEPT|nr:helix-turn-helix domain-containing protein [Leptospira gomenensis]TGK39204.1 AraC family transcriptional regulator [Leptospira gomenensis]TGK44255.1 AraC family transcriptional regulator [Leptospira gomenensis]TGK45075.1 AraC family transcriptional regulator [Leptospira gomenensis]TGK65117.1 AraC family transcriptional regulator [Leptospira gomenensis]
MPSEIFYATSLQYVLLGVLSFFKWKKKFQRIQSVLFICLGCNLFLFSIKGGLELKLFNRLVDFLYSFFTFMGTILICSTFDDEIAEDRLSALSETQGKFWIQQKLIHGGAKAWGIGSVFLICWNSELARIVPPMMIVVASVSIVVLIVYSIYLYFFSNFRDKKRVTILLGFWALVLAGELAQNLLSSEFHHSASMLGGLVLAVFPIYTFGSLFLDSKSFKENLDSTYQERFKLKQNEKLSSTSYYLSNMDIKEIETRMYELFTKEKVFLDEDIRLGSVAEELGLSTHQLSAFINQHLGTNFNNLVNLFRVKEAIQILKDEPDRSIISVGMAVGFNSLSTFQRAFLSITKSSPKKFRENLKNGATRDLPQELDFSRR